MQLEEELRTILVKHVHLGHFQLICLERVIHARHHVPLVKRSQLHAQPMQMHNVELVNLVSSKQALELALAPPAQLVYWVRPFNRRLAQPQPTHNAARVQPLVLPENIYLPLVMPSVISFVQRAPSLAIVEPCNISLEHARHHQIQHVLHAQRAAE